MPSCKTCPECGLNIADQQWKRDRKYSDKVALKKFDNFVNSNDVLNEMAIHLKTHGDSSIEFYGITHMIVLQYASDRNLREYLKINFDNINWEQKLLNLWGLSLNLRNVHSLDIVHQDFHPGDILSGFLPPLYHMNNYEVLDIRAIYRPTFKGLDDELYKYYYGYKSYLEGRNRDSEIGIQIKKS
ncbi:hypothetical protein Glove_165g27 [Diversispora epigaea]|uniref:Serine-threonine/tyrosine-protein kinase catalytic domain-containing protein n=1 Tax=Diversispora epigaea TaxID=1348612 RepID=A0A397J0G0_9GLOM|nr:hypothetical protein Glove_165g27 [Diversispora epigaea]